MKKQKILIVKLSAIGDVVMALPMIEAAQKKYGEDVEITWVCGKTASPIIRTFFENVKVVEIDEKKLLKGSLLEKISEVIKIWLKIAFKKFVLVATAHSDIRYRLLTLPVIAKTKRHWGITNGRKHPVSGRYHGIEAVWLITGDDDSKMTILPKSKMWQVQKRCSPTYGGGAVTQVTEGVLYKSKKKVVLVPGGAKNVLADNPCRRWSLDKYVELAQKLLEKNYEVILVGSDSDKWVNEAFNNLKVTNLIGKTDLIELLGILRQADVVVTHDTGTLHLAQLASKKIIALFGPTNPYEKIQKSDSNIIIWKPENLACCPCYDGKTYAECKQNKCMDKITVKEVLEVICG